MPHASSVLFQVATLPATRGSGTPQQGVSHPLTLYLRVLEPGSPESGCWHVPANDLPGGKTVVSPNKMPYLCKLYKNAGPGQHELRPRSSSLVDLAVNPSPSFLGMLPGQHEPRSPSGHCLSQRFPVAPTHLLKVKLISSSFYAGFKNSI